MSDHSVPHAYWSVPAADLLAALGSGANGLSDEDAERRLREAGSSPLRNREALSRLRLFWRQAKNPLLLLLVFAALVAALTGEWTEAGIVLTIVTVTITIGFVREYQAETAAATLRQRIRTRAVVVRGGIERTIGREEVVAGDIFALSAGSLVPADGILLESSDLFLSESALTGESFPVEKAPGISPVTAALAARGNAVFLGTNVRSGTARALAVRIGSATEIGAIANQLSRPSPESDFDRGLRRFGYFLTVSMLMLVLMVFAAHMLRGRPAIETLLFSIALAVGLSPELLPAILSVNLARGAHVMAGRGVLVRRLNAIENLGSMDVLCTDKTGTLTEGVVRVDGSFDTEGRPSDVPRAYAVTNASLATGLPNPLDQAILSEVGSGTPAAEKLGEIPFDFARRRVSIVIAAGDEAEIVTKGAVSAVLDACTLVDGAPLDTAARAAIDDRIAAWTSEGTRVIAVASRRLGRKERYTRDDECRLTLHGFLTFLDRPKGDAARAVADLAHLNVRVAVITGDHHLVAAHVAEQVGLRHDAMLTGADLDALDDPALWRAVESTDVFAEVDPNQKERILRALKRNNHVVGFLGDGVNDAPAMHIADTSLSVEGAVDVAREAADFVLLDRDLDVIRGGIEAGRHTFINTLKYVLTTMSANLGNMISMASASLLLPFLPMTAAQILLNNLLSDLPAFGLADDNVDPEAIERPPRWDVRFIGAFMIEFGLISSAFDVLTFVILLFAFRASVAEFQTAWFVESLLTELVVALVVRTTRPCVRSRPGPLLLYGTIGIGIVGCVAPFVPGAHLLGFVPLSVSMMASLVAVTLAYAATVEVFKAAFYRRRRRQVAS